MSFRGFLTEFELVLGFPIGWLLVVAVPSAAALVAIWLFA
jgi:hypothetical protein